MGTQSAHAFDFRLSGFTTQRFNLRGNHRDTTLLYNEALGVFDTSTYLQPQALDPAYSGFVELGMVMEATDWLNVSLTANSGEIRYRTRSFDGTTTLSSAWTSNGRLVADEASQSLFIREALLDIHDPDTGWWQVRAGRRLWRVAQSLIYDDFGLGAGVNFDLNVKQGTPLRFEAAYLIPTRDFQPLPLASPFVTAKVDYVLSLFESVSLGGAYFFDGAGELGETFRQGFVESVLTLPNLRRIPARREAFETARQRSLIAAFSKPIVSNTHLAYGFASLTKTLGPGTLLGTIVGSGGKTSLCTAPATIDSTEDNLTCDSPTQQLTLLGLAFDVSYKWSISDRLQLTPFFFGQSGSKPATRNQTSPYTAYIGVLPFITRTNLFFLGGLSETFGARQLTAAGVNGRGVIAPGLTFIADPLDTLRLKTTVAFLSAWAGGIATPIGGGGSFYGVEVDGIVDFRPFDVVGFVAEADVLFGGNFYGTVQPVFKVIAGIDLSFVWEPLAP